MAKKVTGDKKTLDVTNISACDQHLEETLNKFTLEQPLTKCEKQILDLIINGKANREIASELSRSARTIEFHRNHLMKKLKAHNAAELAIRAISMGLLKQ